MRYKGRLFVLFLILFIGFFVQTRECTNEKKGLKEYQRIPFCHTEEHKIKRNLYQKSVLPSSIVEIEEEAFEGTALTSLALPDTVNKIGDYAFANISSLRIISIPDNTISIGENTFKGSNQVTIAGAYQSYAKEWAEKNRIPFSPIDHFYVFANAGQITGNSCDETRSPKIILDHVKVSNNNKSKQTGRLIGDSFTIRYMEFNAFHVQGRAPPII